MSKDIPRNQNQLAVELHLINERLPRLEDKLDEDLRARRRMSEKLDQILVGVVTNRDELREITSRCSVEP